MHLTILNRARARIQWPVAAFTALCGVAIAVGGLLTWIDERGPRPSMGMNHTSFSGMLVYTLRSGVSYWKSVGFVVLILGTLIAIGALTGLRTLTALAAVLTLGAAATWIGLIAHHYNTPNLPNSHYLNPANLPWSDLSAGAWLTIFAAALALISAPLLHRRANGTT
jgi:hypothetical protein